MEAEHIVEMRGISKSFGGVQALRRVDFELRRGEIMGVVGDNGAGKSTLMKVLAGAYLPDEGEIYVDGQRADIKTPHDAFRLGIGMIYQDLALFNNLDVARNIYVGRDLARGPFHAFLDKRRMYEKAEHLIRELKVDIKSPKMSVARMSGGQRQMVACARAMAFQSKILIMDEPTAALGVTEANKLLALIRHLRGMGVSILLITQRIPDILAIADRVFVLKGGRRQDILEVGQVTLDDVVTLIVKGKAPAAAEGVPEMEFRSFG
ncbi:MAG: ATP-binding cassette domain-containing protein [Chloroflexi bacterium]|nr:ATP-binding cassette domain-containing protein [Chloroflexota bacterium]